MKWFYFTVYFLHFFSHLNVIGLVGGLSVDLFFSGNYSCLPFFSFWSWYMKFIWSLFIFSTFICARLPTVEEAPLEFLDMEVRAAIFCWYVRSLWSLTVLLRNFYYTAPLLANLLSWKTWLHCLSISACFLPSASIAWYCFIRFWSLSTDSSPPWRPPSGWPLDMRECCCSLAPLSAVLPLATGCSSLPGPCSV